MKSTRISMRRWATVLTGVAVLAMAMSAVGAPSSAAEEASWALRVQPVTQPSPRTFAKMAQDPLTGSVVLAGGDDDTWTWDGQTRIWERHIVPGPGAREDHSMAYDPSTNTTFLFGGRQRGINRDDTWTWDGTAWTLRCGGGLPNCGTSPNSGAAMAASPTAGVVMFGGTFGEPFTWKWNASNNVWYLVCGAGPECPPQRANAAMAAQADGTLVMFGGGGRKDTWTWDGASWSQHCGTVSTTVCGPIGRTGAAMALDPITNTVLLFGGTTVIAGFLGDTWSWDGVGWTERHPQTSPTPRAYHSMATDPASNTVILYGGHTATPGETWIYRGTTNAPGADLTLSMTDTPDPVKVNTPLTYTLTATNSGPDPATGVAVTDVLPADVTYQSSTATQGTCSNSSNTGVNCNLGPMAAGDSATVTITVVPTQTGEARNTASVSSPVTDPNPANNQATSSTMVGEAVLQRPVADFDGDRKTDVSVFRPSTGTWFVRRSGGGDTAVQFGAQDDVPVAGDYDGDGTTDVAVFRPSDGVWYVKGSTAGESASQFGTAGDVPVPGDYDGDGKTDLAVYRPPEGVWYLRGSTAGDSAVRFGTVGDIGVPGDYDGDGRTDLAVYRPSEGVWYVRASTTGGDSATRFGTGGDVPVPGDYNGDGRIDLGVFRPTEGVWYQRPSGGGGDTSTQFGTFGDIPVPGTYDSDSRTDVAVYRPTEGVWYQRATTAGDSSTQFGTSGDLPIPLPSAIRQAIP